MQGCGYSIGSVLFLVRLQLEAELKYFLVSTLELKVQPPTSCRAPNLANVLEKQRDVAAAVAAAVICSSAIKASEDKGQCFSWRAEADDKLMPENLLLLKQIGHDLT